MLESDYLINFLFKISDKLCSKYLIFVVIPNFTSDLYDTRN